MKKYNELHYCSCGVKHDVWEDYRNGVVKFKVGTLVGLILGVTVGFFIAQF